MARKKERPDNSSVLFDIVYENGSLSSNRKVPNAELSGLDGDEPARAFIEAQDRKIAELSGSPRGRVKSLKRSSKQ